MNAQKAELKKMLSMDLAERLIRVEQTVSASFNKDVSYDKTAYYLSMTPQQRKEFDEYLKNKKKKKVFLSSFIFACMFGLSIFSLGITGNVVNESNAKIFSIAEISLAVILVLLVVYLVFSWISNMLKNKRFDKHSEILNNLTLSKRIRK
jgi:hypothetical protein